MKRSICLTALLTLSVAASAATISIDPISRVARAGSTIDFNVQVGAVTDLYAYQFHVSFDSNILTAISVSEGAFLSGGGATFFVPGYTDDFGATFYFTANTLLGPTPGVSGSGILATVRVGARSTGTTQIVVSDIVLLDSAGNELSKDVQWGRATVIPEPSFSLLLGAVILVFGQWLRHHPTTQAPPLPTR
jgi:hypothetical protein